MVDRIDGLWLVEVTAVPVGTSTTAAVAAGATVLPVGNAYPFRAGTGWARVDSTQVVPFTAADLDADTVTLASAVTGPLDDGAAVVLWDAAAGAEVTEMQAFVVDPGVSEAEPYVVDVTHPLSYGSLPEGPVDPPMVVSIAQDASGVWYLAELDDQAVVLDGGNLDPTTLPEPVPVAPPTVSPGVRVVGDADGLTLVTDGVDPTTTIDYYVNGALYASTRANVLWVGAGDAGLVPDTDYPVYVVAHNAAGAAAPSATVIGRLDPGVSPEQTIARLNVAILSGGVIQIGSGVTISADDGVRIEGTDGRLIWLTASGDRPQIRGVTVETDDLVVNGGLTINSPPDKPANHINGSLVLSDKLSNPSAAPTVQEWDPTYTLGWARTGSYGQRGLAQTSDGYGWVVLTSDGQVSQIRVFKTADRAVDQTVDLGDWQAGGVMPLSVCRGGSTLYVLCQRWSTVRSQWELVVRRYTDGSTDPAHQISYISQTALLNSDGSQTAPAAYSSAIAYDSTDSTLWVVSQHTSNNRVVVRRYTTGGVWQSQHVTTVLVDRVAYGAVVSAADWGEKRLWVAGWGQDATEILCIDPTTWTQDSYGRFGRSGELGLYWDGTRFWSLTSGPASSPQLRKFSTMLWGGVAAKYTWYDSDTSSGVHESAASPTAPSVMLGNRRSIRVVTPHQPDNGTTDGADSVRLYLDDGVDGWRLRATVSSAAGPNIIDCDPPIGGPVQNAPAVSTFPAGSSIGKVVTAAVDVNGFSLGELRGDGYVRMVGNTSWQTMALVNGYTAGATVPKYRLEPDGVVRMRGIISMGTATDGTVAATLPVGFRPSDTFRVGVMCNPTATATGRVVIGTDGKITLSKNAGTPTAYYIDGAFSTV